MTREAVSVGSCSRPFPSHEYETRSLSPKSGVRGSQQVLDISLRAVPRVTLGTGTGVRKR